MCCEAVGQLEKVNNTSLKKHRNCGTYPGRFTETQFLCIVRASSLKSLGTLLKPLQTAIDFYVRIRINQPINDLEIS